MSRQQYEKQMSIKRTDFLEKGYELFSRKTIEAVNLTDVADASDYGIATLYRYFQKKPGFVVEVATWKWQQLLEENERWKEERSFDDMTAARLLELFLENFMTVYRRHPDLLRFNEFFNVYVQSGDVDDEALEPCRSLVRELEKPFQVMYERALSDGTVKTDMPEKEMYSVIMHLMLSTVTTYAVGTIYQPDGGFDAEKEMALLREMLLDRFVVR